MNLNVLLYINKNGEKRRVRQYHYTAWPDHGVPDTMSPFISFYKKIKTETYQIDRPLLVHCSTGVGRTGIFIAMSNLLDQAHFHQHIDFYKCVTLMKECRPQIIQTEEEYIFLHHVVNEVLRTSIDICTPIELDRKVASLTSPDNTEYLSMDGVVVEEYEQMGEPVEEQVLDVDKRQVKENIE
ncbi:PTPRD [Bugula neritina]|uniref:PTPRD n=1 Tax=Bugula neritina TaxID=10212 RepID=A0A7J7K3W8_BUGNE|nr:PTPRD [Bugula neritina]